jgi:hypothetical protein
MREIYSNYCKKFTGSLRAKQFVFICLWRALPRNHQYFTEEPIIFDLCMGHVTELCPCNLVYKKKKEEAQPSFTQ